MVFANVRSGGWRCDPIVPSPAMGRLAWRVTQPQIVSLLFGRSLVPHEGWDL